MMVDCPCCADTIEICTRSVIRPGDYDWVCFCRPTPGIFTMVRHLDPNDFRNDRLVIGELKTPRGRVPEEVAAAYRLGGPRVAAELHAELCS